MTLPGFRHSTLATINYANESLKAIGASSAELSTLLNGSPLNAAGGSVGVLPVLGLIASIQAKDPIGAAMSIGVMWQGAPFLTTNPVGWALIAAKHPQSHPLRRWPARCMGRGQGHVRRGLHQR